VLAVSDATPAVDNSDPHAFPCRFCGALVRDPVVDLGMSPLCESFLTAEQLDAMEPFYPLNARVCANCLLVQINDYVTAESIFTEYAYYSSFSTSWLEHAKSYVEATSERLGWRPLLDLDAALAWTVSWYKGWNGGAGARALAEEQIGRYMEGRVA